MSRQMQSITVLTKAAEPDAFDVFWKPGARKQGVVRVWVPIEVEDKPIVAELAALHHLLADQAVLGADRGGNAVRCTVSFGAIKKLAKRAAGKHHLHEYGRYLATRWAGMQIEVDKDESWIQPRALERRCEIEVKGPPRELVLLHEAGEVEVTAHAIDEFALRHNIDDFAKAWRMLRNMAQDRSISVIERCDLDAKDKARGTQTKEILFHPRTGWHFVVTTGRGGRQLVTTYCKG